MERRPAARKTENLMMSYGAEACAEDDGAAKLQRPPVRSHILLGIRNCVRCSAHVLWWLLSFQVFAATPYSRRKPLAQMSWKLMCCGMMHQARAEGDKAMVQPSISTVDLQSMRAVQRNADADNDIYKLKGKVWPCICCAFHVVLLYPAGSSVSGPVAYASIQQGGRFSGINGRELTGKSLCHAGKICRRNKPCRNYQ